ncbi:hypothetical protein ACPWT1_22295 [Ramlibacter sp. MMS24-I3-19]|uniref:hypothetical protein n=1 Tax=Ramlibacter sp. MMS24-I3-19 TaxID=3416606 RepID=UPI003D0462D3
MHAYEPGFLDGHSTLVRVLRGAVAVAVVGLTAAAWLTAGPGNYDRTAPVRVALDPVTVVGHREVADSTQSPTLVGGCERSQIDSGRTARKVG